MAHEIEDRVPDGIAWHERPRIKRMIASIEDVAEVNDNETLLRLLMYRADPEMRGYLMAEAPGAYRRYMERQGREMPLNVFIEETELPF